MGRLTKADRSTVLTAHTKRTENCTQYTKRTDEIASCVSVPSFLKTDVSTRCG